MSLNPLNNNYNTNVSQSKSSSKSEKPSMLQNKTVTGFVARVLKVLTSFSQAVDFGSSKKPLGTDSQSKRKVSAFDAKFPNISSCKSNGKEYSVEDSHVSSQSTLEAGGKPQGKFIVTGSDGETIKARMKPLKTLNEAVIFHRMKLSNDSLAKYTPEMLGVFDQGGMQIDLSNFLDTNPSPDDFKKLGVVYFLMKDLTTDLNLDDASDIQDFKFTNRSLQGNNNEAKAHGYRVHSSLFREVRNCFFKLSACPFAFQTGTKGWGSFLIRLKSLFGTQNALKEQLSRLPKDQLEAVKDRLMEMKEDVKTSKFVFADSSLLFIPITDEDGKPDLKINWIDLSHGAADAESIEGTDYMKDSMLKSIDFLIDLTKKALK
jgi:hypothetical protein